MNAMELDRLYTEIEAAEALGIKPRSLRTERFAGRIGFQRVAGKIMYRHSDLQKWMVRGEKPWPDVERDRGSSISTSEPVTTSAGPKTDGPAKEAQVRKISDSLKKRSRNSSPSAAPEAAPVTRLDSRSSTRSGSTPSKKAPHTASPERIGYGIDALAEFFSENVAADVSEQTCRAYGVHRGRADGTIRRELGILRAALRYAEHTGRLTRAPHVWLPPKPPGKSRWLTRDEGASLLRAARRSASARPYLPLFILLGLYTGARKGAILSLRWPQVDLERGRIDFNPPGQPQTAKRKPVIPIPRRLMTFLRLARARGSDLGYVVHRDGKPIGNVVRAFNTACARAGLAEVTPHTLRHTAGTWMAQHGVPLWDIAGYLGHSHERMTELYSHHSPNYLERARKAFD